jgi:transposase InsO family protein
MNRRAGAPIDLDHWPEFDPCALTKVKRKAFAARRQAVELYVASTAVSAIEAQTGINRRQLYRLLAHCCTPHADGRAFGWRALVPYTHVATYQRTVKIQRQGDGAGSAGAFGLLLEGNPSLAAWIAEQIRAKRVSVDQLSTDDGLRLRVRGLTKLHGAFLEQCRALRLTSADYPFNTDHMAIRSLASAVRAECLRTFERGAHLAGASHLKGMPKAMSKSTPGSAPIATQALDVVEFDGHRLDVRLKVVVRDPLGFEQEFEIERIWLLVIVDVWSRAVLGYHVSLNREYSRYDVIRTIENALAPHRPRQFTLPGVGYGDRGGFPSGKLTEIGYASWQWFKLDNAKANLAADVQYALADFVGCLIDAGPAHSPDDRPYIERFFGTVASSLSSRLPGYTGTNARDIRRALADPKGNLRLFVSLDELEDLLEASLAQYNASPHNGLNGRTPLEAVEHSVRGHGAMLNWLPEAKRRTLCLMHTPHTSTVRGYLDQGQRPHVNFHGVRYTNAVLASTALYLGRKLRLYYNSQDLRTVRAFADDGAEIGVLKAQGAWGEIVHDLKLRQEVVRLRGRKHLAGAMNHEGLTQFIEDKLAKAKRSRRGASELAQTLRSLAAAPTSMSPQAPAAAAVPSAPEPPTSPSARVKPRKLSIQPGFVGSLP